MCTAVGQGGTSKLMVGLKRRRKIEGWAVDVSETDADVGRSTLRQRLADNNRLWLLSLLVVVILTGYFIKDAAQTGQTEVNKRLPSARAPQNYKDEAHQAFSRKFMLDKSLGFKIISAEFVAPDQFRIVVPGNVSKDDLGYAAVIAGNKIVSEFHFRAVIQVYKRGAHGVEMLAATAQWEPDQYGYIVKHRAIGRNATP